MDGLEADMQQFREELNDVWGRMEADAEAYSFGYHPGCSPTSPVTSCAFVGYGGF